MDLVSRIQRLPIGRFHYTLLVVIGLGWMFDAMDTGLISFILAKMAEDWQMTADQKAGWCRSVLSAWRSGRFVQVAWQTVLAVKQSLLRPWSFIAWPLQLVLLHRI